MEVYKIKDFNKEDIDNMVKIITKEKEKFELKHTNTPFKYRSPRLKLDYCYFCFRFIHLGSGSWVLGFVIINDIFYKPEPYHNEYLDYDYFESKTLKELIVKYINNSYYYDKHSNEICRYEKYEENQLVRKLFPTNIECSVCYDSLSGDYKTKCNHHLCLECYHKLQGKKLCPLCKKCLCCGVIEKDCEDEDED